MTKPAPPNRLSLLRGDKPRYVLAVDLGVGPTTIYRWETSRDAIPTRRVVQLAKHFGVSPAYLMGWSDRRDEKAAA